MSQQINLLKARPHPQAVALASVAFLGVALLVLAGMGLGKMHTTSKLRDELSAAQLQLRDMKTALASAQALRQGPNGPVALEAEVVALRTRSLTLAPLVASIQNGNAGSPTGSSRSLLTLASLAQDDVWINLFETGVKPGETTIGGRAMRNDSAVRYARRLNDAFKPMNIQFSALELRTEGLNAPPVPGQPAPPPAPGVAVVNFKIS